MKKVFRDPIHNYIEVNEPLIWNLINTPAFQRLNNIKQLGGAFQIFHGAMHTRFGHSLGAYFIAKQMLEEVPGMKGSLTDREQLLVLCAALLHDIGHGPYSHASEGFLKLHHEEMTCKIIIEDETISGILHLQDAEFANDVVKILQKTYENPLLSKIVSSQVDVDRMDYLLRDAYYAGVPYGEYDKDRIIHVMEVENGELLIRESGIYAVEDFMLSRYQMRQQVYMNAKGRAFEIMLNHLVRRFIELYDEEKLSKEKLYTQLYNFLKSDQHSDVQNFLLLDDASILTIQKMLCDEEDPIISNLAKGLTERNLPKSFEVPTREEYLKIVQGLSRVAEEGSDLQYYIYCEQLTEQSVYFSGQTADKIKIKMKTGEVVPIEDASTIMQALEEQMIENKYYVYINQMYLTNSNKNYKEILKELGVL